MADTVRPGIYRHFKGKMYIVYGVAEDATNPRPGELPDPPKVFYRQDYEPRKLCYRSVRDFLEEVDRPDHGYKGRRFVFIRPL
ncbi:MAG TPA: DUF1653 domain-containing protein [Patescibacteria group bacterium]|nr:DUF1653 domain-containing protein [Patescibacteria group bacterium]